MRVSRIYYDGLLVEGQHVSLPLETSHYIMNVLRLKMGAKIILFNGTGGEFIALVTSMQKKCVSVEIGTYQEKSLESPLSIHLAQGISRGEKMDFILQKAVELGVTKITPLITDFCNVHLDEARAAKRLAHWHKIIISACEQSGRTLLPCLEPIQLIDHWLDKDLETLRIFCDPRAKKSIHTLTQQNKLVVLVGPEGGFSNKEILKAEAKNFIGISLGPRILRTETAPLATIAILQYGWGDL